MIRLLLVLALFLPPAGNVLDDGTGIDPHGGRFTASADDGNGLDPHGGRFKASTDEGNGIDPHGKP